MLSAEHAEELISRARAIQRNLTSDWLSAKTAGQIRSVNRIVSAKNLEEATDEIAEKLANGSAMASEPIRKGYFRLPADMGRMGAFPCFAFDD